MPLPHAMRPANRTKKPGRSARYRCTLHIFGQRYREIVNTTDDLPEAVRLLATEQTALRAADPHGTIVMNVQDAESGSRQRFTYDPHSRDLDISHLTHPDADDQDVLDELAKTMTALEDKAEKLLGTISGERWIEHSDPEVRERTRRELFDVVQKEHADAIRRIARALAERDRSADALLEQTAEILEKAGLDMYITLTGTGEDTDSDSSVMSALADVKTPDQIARMMLYRIT